MTAPLSLSLLGSFQARLASGRAITLPTKKARALLAYLALHPGDAHPRAKLATLLWIDTGEEQARSNLRQALFALRRALPDATPPSLLIEGETVALNPAAAEVDVVIFEECVGTGTVEALERAAALYRGDLLEALDLKEAPFDEWLRAERERLRELVLNALDRLLAHHVSTAAPEQAILTAMRLLALDPVQEPVHRTLMRLYAGQGRRGAALRQYQLCVGVLQQELGVEPEAETRQLYQEILQRRRILQPVARAASPVRHVHRSQRGGVQPRTGTARLETLLIGREAEWANLSQALEAAWQGHGRAVVIVGEVGIGKSRLAAELQAEAVRRGGQVLVGRCYELEQILPFRPWVDALGSGLEGRHAAELEALSPVWRAELARLLPEWAETEPPPPMASDDYLRLFEAVAQLLASLVSRRPLALILEDLHWADEMSLRLLGFLIRRASTWSALIVGTVREEELADAPILRRLLEALNPEDRLLALRLSPLSKRDTEHLVRTLLESDDMDESALARLAEQIQAASEGNPFMVVETVRALREGSWPGATSGLALPDRVREVTASRLERLSERGRKLVAAAAVIGREFEFALVQRAAGLAAPDAAEAMEELVRRRVLHGVGEKFDFTHDRIREVALGTLLSPHRALLHRQVAEAMEEIHADNLEPHYAALGVHYREGEVWAKAFSYLRQAGARAAARSAYREAVAGFEQALVTLRHLPETRTTLQQGIDLRFDLRSSLQALGEHERVFEHLRDAETLASALADQDRLGWASAYLSQYLWWMGDRVQAEALGQRALIIASALGDFALEVAANFFLGQGYYLAGDHRRAIDHCRRNAAGLVGEPAYERYGLTGLPAVLSRVWLARSLADRGEFAEAIRHARDAVSIAEAAGQRYSEAVACLGVGQVHVLRGAFSLALPVLQRAVELCTTWHVRFFFPWSAATLGLAYALGGRVAEALSLLDEGAAEVPSAGIFGALTTITLSTGYLLAGRLDEAAGLASSASVLATERGFGGIQAQASWLLAEIGARRDPQDLARAENHYRRALTLAEELGVRPLAAHCRCGLGTLYRRAGDRSKAAEHLTLSSAMYRGMDMGYWLAQAEAELAEAT